MRKIIYTRPDGGLSVVHPVRNNGETLSDAEVEQRAWDKLPATATSPRFVSSVPEDRSFRESWTDIPGVDAPSVDLLKAQAIQQDRIETARKEAMQDVLLRESLGEDVTAEKARIKAIDPYALVSDKADPAALKDAWPPGLAKR